MDANARELWDILRTLKEHELDIRELLSRENASDAVKGLSGALIAVTNAFSERAVDLLSILEKSKQRQKAIEEKYQEVSKLERETSDTLAKAARIDLSKIYEAQEVRELLSTSKQRCTQLEADLDSARRQIESLEAEKAALNEEKLQAKGQIVQLRQEVENARAENVAIKGEVEHLKAENTALEKAKLHADGQITELRQRIKDVRSESKTAAQAEIDQLTDRLMILEQNNSLLTSVRDTIQGENKELRQQMLELRQRAEDLQRVKDRLQDELAQAKESSAFLEKDLRLAQENSETARGDMERWKKHYNDEVTRARAALLTNIHENVERILRWHTDRVRDEVRQRQDEQYQAIYQTLQQIQRTQDRDSETETLIGQHIKAQADSSAMEIQRLAHSVAEDIQVLSNSIAGEFSQQSKAQHGFATEIRDMIARLSQPQPQQGQARADSSAQQGHDAPSIASPRRRSQTSPAEPTPSPRLQGVSGSPELGESFLTSPSPGPGPSGRPFGETIPLEELRRMMGVGASTGLDRRPSTSESNKQFLEEKAKRLRMGGTESSESPAASDRPQSQIPQPVRGEASRTHIPASTQSPHPAPVPPRTPSRSMIPRLSAASPTPSPPSGVPFPGRSGPRQGRLSLGSSMPQTTSTSAVPQSNVPSGVPSQPTAQSGTSTSTLAPQPIARGGTHGVIGRTILRAKTSIQKITGESQDKDKRRKSAAATEPAGPSSAASESTSTIAAVGHGGQAEASSSGAPAAAVQTRAPPVRIDVRSNRRVQNSILYERVRKTFTQDADFSARNRNYNRNNPTLTECWWGRHIRKHDTKWTDPSGPCHGCQVATTPVQCMVMVEPTVALLFNPQPGDAESQAAFDRQNAAEEAEEAREGRAE